MLALFEERSGVVPCGMLWGQWYQTLEEVFTEVQVPPGMPMQDIQCGLQSQHVPLALGGCKMPKGKFFDSTTADKETEEWSILFTKTKRDAANSEISGNYTKGEPDFSNLFFLRFYLFIHDRHREREAETEAEGEAGSMQGAQRETRSQVSRITPWAEGRRSTTEPPRLPRFLKS
ncbi:unnamed protein product [Nyctereutes procyonoides]|uniref:(raccoon dog) hypothetical protein n=1 Tax=Nyctereutes procyonoides TaxID=34880 RepID=A0A811ZI82_NYCPR|nr:unnamed protein product [Nyctereutes procyonoides]